MLDWLFLLVFLVLGGWILARPDRLSFRGSTVLGYFVLSLGMTTPLVLHPMKMMLVSGAGLDAFIGVWNLWWARTALSHGWNPLETAWLFHPNGTSLALHTYSLTYGVLSLPVQGIAGLVAARPASLFAAYNAILLLSFTLTGYLTYRFALAETGRFGAPHRGAALLAGAVFAFTNYRFANTVRLHVMATEFLVLAAWAFTTWMRDRTPLRFAALAGACVLLIYASLEYAAYAVLLFAILAAPSLGSWIGRRRSAGSVDLPAAKGAKHAVVVLAALVPLLPLLISLKGRLSEGNTSFDPRMAAFFSADLVDFFLPNPRHPFWGRLFQPTTAGFHNGDGGFGLSIGWVVLGLAIVSTLALLRVRRGRIWLWGFLAFWILSLGPTLHVAGTVTGIPLPQAALSKVLPFLAGSRTPIRYLAPAGLCLAMLLATGWSVLRAGETMAGSPSTRVPDSRAPSRSGEPAVRAARLSRTEIVIGALLLFEMLAAPMPMAPIPVPDCYRHIVAPPGSSSLIHIPGLPAREELLYQTVHQQRLIQNLESAIPLRSRRGQDPFADPSWTALTRGLGEPRWINSLSEAQHAMLSRTLRDFLRKYDVRWIVLLRSHPVLSDKGTGVVSQPLLDDGADRFFRENLEQLGPVSRQEFPEGTVLEMAVD